MPARPSAAQEHLRVVIPSRLEELEALIDTTDAFVKRHESSEDRAYTVLLLASEAITNAIEHGNGLDETKTVTIDYWARNGCIEVWVEDQGDGFDRASIADPLAREHLYDEGGRGIYLIEELADEVRYERGGRRIGMLFAVTAA
jgi:serine/threonine-protein kinase RsbW